MTPAISEDSDQTARMRRLIRVFAGRTGLTVGSVMRWLKLLFVLNFEQGHFTSCCCLKLPVLGKQCRSSSEAICYV